MAWKKSMTDESTGVVYEHWDMILINYQHRSGMSEMIVGAWVNKEAYDAGRDPVRTKSYVIPAGTNPQLATAALAYVSGYVRAQPEFEGSEDA